MMEMYCLLIFDFTLLKLYCFKLFDYFTNLINSRKVSPSAFS